MKRYLSLILFSFVLQTPARGFDECQDITPSSLRHIHELTRNVQEVTSAMTQTQKVLGVTVTKYYQNQGSGKVSVLTDEKGNLTGLRVDFAIKGKKTDTMIKTFEELKSGQKLEYKETSDAKAALVVKKASGATIYPTTGGQFTFSILTEKPSTYEHYSLYLRKEGGAWVIKDLSGKKLNSVDLTPKAESVTKWAGTFSEASFN